MNVIDDVLIGYTPRLDSHRSSWPRMQSCMLRDMGVYCEPVGSGIDAIGDAETWYVSHGMEFNGKYNLNGGWEEDHQTRLRLMLEKGVDNVISLERNMPNLAEVCRPRAEQSDYNLTDAEWVELEDLCKNVRTLTHQDLWRGGRVVLGDSHSIARYTKGSLVLRNDGLTLHGMLKRGIKNMLVEAGLNSVERLVIQAGNIDIRHHLARQADPWSAVDSLVGDLWTQLDRLQADGFVFDYEVTAPYPIEHEDRKLPKTGYYKGTPFYGSRDERVAIAGRMTFEMITRFSDVYLWPQRWYEMDPAEYAAEFMEKPRSVHLSPRHHEWNYETNERNR